VFLLFLLAGLLVGLPKKWCLEGIRHYTVSEPCDQDQDA